MGLLERLLRLEEEGRHRALARGEPPRSDAGWLERVEEACAEMGEELERLGAGEWAAVADWIALAAEGTLRSAAEFCERRGVPRGECPVPPSAQEDLAAVDEAFRAAGGGTRCTWLLGEAEPYTLSAAINDLTSCFHRVVERLQDLSKAFRRVGKCLLRSPDPALEEACSAWSRAAEALHDAGLLTESNWEAMYFRAEGTRAEARVGEAPGHAAHMDLQTGTLEYYGTEPDARLAEILLEEWCGLDCESGGGVTACWRLTRRNAPCAAQVLAALSSSRFRIAEPEKWWREIPEECRTPDPVRREACLLSKLLHKPHS